LNCGADGARADDTMNLKFIIAVWLMQMVLTPKPPIQCQDKYCRRFYHDVTGRFLCPAIRSYHPDYHVTAYSWPSFLYKDGQYDAINPTKGFLKGELRVKAVKYIFTSPSSAEEDPEILQPDASTKTPSQPRALAYMAVQVGSSLHSNHSLMTEWIQLCFALSSASTWRIINDDFNHNEFYHNIVDYFELPSSPDVTNWDGF
ncbi:hypothetical protein BD769DRAFT_1357888, partial [Suillus cothurnatus]